MRLDIFRNLTGQRMLLKKDIQMIMAISGRHSSINSRETMRPFCLLATVAMLWLATVALPSNAASGDGVHPVTASEIALRRGIENANEELRQLKLPFMKQTSKIYLQGLKLDPIIGIQAAKQTGSVESIGLLLAAEEFLTIVIKQYIIYRRVMAGLRVLYLRLLPIRTLERLVSKFPAFQWLKGRSKVDLTPAFPEATESQWIQLYAIIDRRARLRAADDILTLTTDNMSRIYKTIRDVLLVAPESELSRPELKAFAGHANKLLDYYLSEIVAYRSDAQIAFEKQIDSSRQLIASFGTQKEFLGFVDRTIDTEALDIDLNKEATNLDLPPTINEEMISNIERKWLPSNVLEAVNIDRAFLLQPKNKQIIKNWVLVTDDKEHESAPAELARLCEIASRDIVNISLQ